MVLRDIVFFIFYILLTSDANENNNTIIGYFFDLPTEEPLIVKEGMRVVLICPLISPNDLSITFINDNTVGKPPTRLIENSQLLDNSSKYSLSETDGTLYEFIINSIGLGDEGAYRCIQLGYDVKLLSLEVIYSPSESPRCYSNYQSPVIFHNEYNGQFVFYCSTENGKPTVTMEIYTNEQIVTSICEVMIKPQEDKETTVCSLSVHLNDTLQNSTFVCNVTQQLSSPYSSYQGSCSFGPLQLISLSVSPLSLIVREGENVTLTCTSNEQGVEMTWVNIPNETHKITTYNTPNEKHNITTFTKSSVLTILSFGLASHRTIVIGCHASYGGENVTRNVSIFPCLDDKDQNNVTNHSNNDNPVTDKLVLIMCVVAMGIVLVVIILTLTLMTLWRKTRCEKRRMKTNPPGNEFQETGISSPIAVQTMETNINNANNTAISTEHGVCINEIYQPFSYGSKTALGADDNKIESSNRWDSDGAIVGSSLDDDHMLMCDNIVYQSFSMMKDE